MRVLQKLNKIRQSIMSDHIETAKTKKVLKTQVFRKMHFHQPKKEFCSSESGNYIIEVIVEKRKTT